jgi:hypothetical protein
MADAHREPDRKGVSSFKSAPEEEMQHLVVTINPAKGGIVKVEKTDKAGKREELSEEECARLIGEDEVEEIQDALDEAFEVAVVSVIGQEDQAEENEDEEEKAIRRFLISDLLIPRAARRRILHRILLSRLLRRRDRNARQRQ